MLMGKVLAARFLHVDNVTAGLVTGYPGAVLSSNASVRKFAVVRYVLFAYYLAFPWLMKATQSPARLLPAALAIHLLQSATCSC